MLKRTPLYQIYKDYPGVKLVDFGGWELPVQFESGIIAEHMAVRTNAGLFDVSHMGEIMVEGPGAADLVNYLVTNDISSMEDGRCLYSPMCRPDGGVVDDILIYRIGKDRYFLVVNASNVEKDYSWISKENPWMQKASDPPLFKNLSAEYGQIALQGPKADEYMREIVGPLVEDIAFFHFKEDISLGGVSCLISRTGYTGEDGFEIYCPAEKAKDVWNTILDATKGRGVIPCGLGARDTLRFEAKLPLYGHEITDTISPLEANLSYFVKLDKSSDFCGKEALAKQKDEGIPRTLRGCEMIDKGVPRDGYKVFLGGREIGHVTSGTKSPMLDSFLGLVLIDRNTGLSFGDEIEIEIGKKKKRAKLVKTPFYKNTGKKS
jgi:aminomethyltransferase